MSERMICRAENPYGTGVCTLDKGHPAIRDSADTSLWFDHYDGGTKIYWSGDIKATERREPVLYAGWEPLMPQPVAGELIEPLVTKALRLVADIEKCPRCKCLVLTEDRIAHQQTEENER